MTKPIVDEAKVSSFGFFKGGDMAKNI
jgi:hypothetical protein